MRKVAVLLFVVVLFVVSCSSPKAECKTGLETYIPEMSAVVDKWNDAFAIAESSARISLADPVASLQEVKREAGAITPPACMADYHDNTVDAMDTLVTMFLDFMSDPDYDFEENGLELFVSMATIEAWESELSDKYDADPDAFVQEIFDLQATEEAAPMGLDEKMTKEAETP